MGIETAILGGAVVSGLMGNEAANTQADATQAAAGQSAEATRYATDLQREMWQRALQDAQPWQTAGKNALAGLVSRGNELTRGFTMQDFQADPGYQFRTQQGLNALEGRAAAGGSLRSGNTLRELMEYGQEMGSQEFGNAYNRFRDTQTRPLNYLQSLAKVGQTENQQMAQSGQQFASNAGNLAMNNAASQGNAMMTGANARATAYGNWGNVLGTAFGSQPVQNALSSWYNNPRPNYTPAYSSYDPNEAALYLG